MKIEILSLTDQHNILIDEDQQYKSFVNDLERRFVNLKNSSEINCSFEEFSEIKRGQKIAIFNWKNGKKNKYQLVGNKTVTHVGLSNSGRVTTRTEYMK